MTPRWDKVRFLENNDNILTSKHTKKISYDPVLIENRDCDPKTVGKALHCKSKHPNVSGSNAASTLNSKMWPKNLPSRIQIRYNFINKFLIFFT